MRSVSIKADLQRLTRLFFGVVASVTAMQTLKDHTPDDEVLDLDSFLAFATDILRARNDMNSIDFTRRVKRKRAKYNRPKPKDDSASGKPDVS